MKVYVTGTDAETVEDAVVYVAGTGEQADDVQWEDLQQSVHRTPEGAERWLREHFPVPEDAVFELVKGTRIWLYEAAGGSHPNIFAYQEHEVKE